MTELVMCRRGPERQAGAARPDLVNGCHSPICAAAGAIPVACARIWKDFQRRCASVAFGASSARMALVHTLLTTAPASTP